MFADDSRPTTSHMTGSARVTGDGRRVQVLVVGGGIATLELVLALRVLAAPYVEVTVVTPQAKFEPRAMTVAAPFGRGGALTHDWRQVTLEQDARLVLDKLVAVDTASRIVHTHGGRRMRYDLLVVATGARRVAPFAGALTFGGADRAGELQALVADLIAGISTSVAFALPSPSTWPLPLYELALLTASELREYGCAAPVRIVTPENDPLAVFGPAARDAVVPLLEALDVELITRAQPCAVAAGGVHLRNGGVVAADAVVTLAAVEARVVAGIPIDRCGFIPVDLHGSVAGQSGVFAAGEATSFPLRQGGLATQQADAVAEAIAAACGAVLDPTPFRPVLRGRMLTSGAPIYLQSRPSGQSLASARALWSPPEKIAGRYLAPYLASARPSRIAAAPLAERVPAAPPSDDGARDALTLALWLAAAEARCGNTTRALQAIDAAHALDPDAARKRPVVTAGNGRPSP
jgi:sulfide:quinone oxidoreductase